MSVTPSNAASPDNIDRQFMLRAIEVARKCTSEPGKVSPKVGAVVVHNGVLLGDA
jgi:pyrimidine deaminase RibD-like protein